MLNRDYPVIHSHKDSSMPILTSLLSSLLTNLKFKATPKALRYAGRDNSLWSWSSINNFKRNDCEGVIKKNKK